MSHPRRVRSMLSVLLAVGVALALPVRVAAAPIAPLRATAEKPTERVTTAISDHEDGTPFTDEELETLVGPIALYPDDLLGIVLPASTYPLQIVQAARYLEQHEKNDS